MLTLPVKINAAVAGGEPVSKPAVYVHAMVYRAPQASPNAEPSQIQTVQFAEPIAPGVKVPPPAGAAGRRGASGRFRAPTCRCRSSGRRAVRPTNAWR